MSQAGSSHHDINTLWSYGRGIKMIHCPSQNSMSIVSNLSAKDNLWITWGYKHFISVVDGDFSQYALQKNCCSGECVDAAELTNVCWLELGGKYAINTMLTEGMTYEVKLVLKLLSDCNIEDPVIFSITTPDGCQHEHKENMVEMPRNQIIGITFGEFQALESYGLAEVEFSMKCTDVGSWKCGMVVIGALVVPKF
ncbi:hypothetical protein POM88_034217 [Heracleum sosnowskyi]|uniref:Uncharacterized protein n=1 Tax=Heracleum sosnowskyi TaxID=360622 RepID=A0AAD8HL88_9APIA|nr:hypothetical protein POM88_034217 [Heracleum sosnowskyi]